MINPWIQAFRLKTLPLALSNTIMGSAVAVLDGGFRWSVFVLAALTTVFSSDYFEHGQRLWRFCKRKRYS
jgi:1,4-dihydroxy-2-naphthoate octaprenyltransferase